MGLYLMREGRQETLEAGLTSECSLLLLRKSSAYFGIKAAPALCAELSSSGDAERAATPGDDALSAREIFDMGAVTRDMMRMDIWCF